ncbi:MAG TPA: hypothetical protein VFL90_05125 [Methylomirabilota bacterium]|nr:hypothetical protein [Methylomirabilota bacterium]
MAIVQAVLALLARSAGKLLNMAFGWATVMLFGRVPEDRQIYLSIAAFGSVLWLVALLGIAVPGAATFLLAFVTLPDWIDRGWIRLAMLVAAAGLPAVVGMISLRMVDRAERPRGAVATARAIARGYPYTAGLALTLIVMTLFAPVLKVRNLFRRWETQHVPVIVEPQDYRSVADDVQRALLAGGLATRRHRASWMLRLPTRILTLFARRQVARMAADDLTTLRGEGTEVLLHPADLVISGRAVQAARVRAVLAERLTVTRACLTWDKQANEIEDRIRAIWSDIAAGHHEAAAAAVSVVHERIQRLEVPYEEWEILFRQALLVEREVLRAGRAPGRRSALGVAATLIAAAPLIEEATDLVRETAQDVRRVVRPRRSGRRRTA